MVEIARAFSVTDTPLSLVILDEPTSSLDAHVAGQLLAFVRRFVAGGGACILISHLLGEILSTADRIIVMRDGKVVAERPAASFTRDSLVAAMGSVAEGRRGRRAAAHGSKRTAGAPRARARPPAQNDGRELTAYRGEVVGLAGLAGQGQTEMLRRLFDAAQRRDAATLPSRSPSRSSPATGRPTASFRSGRSRKNITVGSMRAMLRGILIDPARESGDGGDLARAHQHPHARRRQQHPLALRRQPAEGALRARARLRCRHRADGRPDARRRHRHQAGSLRA